MSVDDLLAPALVLPVRGRGLRIPPPTAWDGLCLHRRLLDLDGALPALEEYSTIRLILGDLWDTLAAELPETELLHVGRTAIMHFGGSEELAAAHWHLGTTAADPKPVDDESAPGYLWPNDPGGGPIVGDPANCMRQWFNEAPRKPTAAQSALSLSWRDVFACWDEVDLDLHDVYGVDVTSGILRRRPWPWLEKRIRDLAMTPGTRLNRAILAPLRM